MRRVGLGVTLQSHEVQGLEDFAAALAAIAEERPHALLVLQDAVAHQQRKEIIDFAITEAAAEHVPGESVGSGGWSDVLRGELSCYVSARSILRGLGFSKAQSPLIYLWNKPRSSTWSSISEPRRRSG